jgi:hypothetical protein
MKTAGVCAVVIVAAGCARVPSGAHFQRTGGFFLSAQKLALPWVPLSSVGDYRWCFGNLSFSASSAQVLLEVVGSKAFDPRNAGGSAAVTITDSSGRLEYQAEGALRDADCCDVPGRNRWVSEYFHYSSGPATDAKSAYFGSPEIRSKIGGFNSYCVALRITQASTEVTGGQARVALQSGWK